MSDADANTPENPSPREARQGDRPDDQFASMLDDADVSNCTDSLPHNSEPEAEHYFVDDDCLAKVVEYEKRLTVGEACFGEVSEEDLPIPDTQSKIVVSDDGRSGHHRKNDKRRPDDGCLHARFI